MVSGIYPRWEMSRFAESATLRPFSVAEAIATPFDPPGYQQTLFVADSLPALLDEVESWLRAVSEGSHN